jgi:protein O-GlcNAc transferase
MKTKRKKQKQVQTGVSKRALSAMELCIDGAKLLDFGKPEEAECTWRNALRQDPRCVSAWCCLTDLLIRGKRMSEAALCLDRVVELSERSARKLLEYGESYLAVSQHQRARQFLQEAMLQDPTLEVQARLLLAKADANEEAWQEAVRETTRVLELEPDNLEALEIRCISWSCLSRVAEQVADMRRYIAIRPHCELHSRLLFQLNHLPETTPESLFEESRLWNRLYAAPLAAEIRPHANIPDPKRRLKIGYVSPDLYAHAVMRQMAPVFEMHDEREFEMFVYSIGAKQDEVTESIQRRVKNFVPLPPSRYEIAERVRSDGIDILVDLAGHTMDTSAYLAFAVKPAPVQVTWMGALATTGLDTIDYFIGDLYLPPPGIEHLFSEKVYRLGRICASYRSLTKDEISDSPYFQNSYITFGCFNNPVKLNRDVVHLWSAILHIVADSKLFLKYHRLGQEITQAHIREWFDGYGISADRLIFEDRSPRTEYLAAWSKVDIALDPFPYNGGTTTVDALWMGVPMVTMPGRLTVGCPGVDVLSTMGLPVAGTPEEYVAHAVALAKAIPISPGIRQRIRAAMASSALLDSAGLVRSLEAAYRDMWRTWCAPRTN